MDERESITLIGAAAARPSPCARSRASGCAHRRASDSAADDLEGRRRPHSCALACMVGPPTVTCGSRVRWGATDVDRVAGMRQNRRAAPDVVLAGVVTALSLQQATATVPIVFVVTDRVGGMVAELAKPGATPRPHHLR